MSDQGPVLNQLDLVVRDVDASVAFYRCLGLDIPNTAIWRTASGAHHVDLHLPSGFTFHLNSIALTKHFDQGWPSRDASGTRAIVGFALPSREAVDARYAQLIAAGYGGPQPPYDTFWGARYAIVEDPDGNHVGLMSPWDPSQQHSPPDL